MRGEEIKTIQKLASTSLNYLVHVIPSLCWNPIWDKIWEKDNLFLFSPWRWSHLVEEMRGCTSMSQWMLLFLHPFSSVLFLWATIDSRCSGGFLCFPSKCTSVKRKDYNLKLKPLSFPKNWSLPHIFSTIFCYYYYALLIQVLKTKCFHVFFYDFPFLLCINVQQMLTFSKILGHESATEYMWNPLPSLLLNNQNHGLRMEPAGTHLQAETEGILSVATAQEDTNNVHSNMFVK